jgi:hypothetical protein
MLLSEVEHPPLLHEISDNAGERFTPCSIVRILQLLGSSVRESYDFFHLTGRISVGRARGDAREEC